jgi:hypothetical protein
VHTNTHQLFFIGVETTTCANMRHFATIIAILFTIIPITLDRTICDSQRYSIIEQLTNNKTHQKHQKNALLETASVSIGMSIFDIAEITKDLSLLWRVFGVGADSGDETCRRSIVAIEHAQQQQVERRRQSWRDHKAVGDVNLVEKVGRGDVRVPRLARMMTGMREHQLGRERRVADRRTCDVDVWHQHVQLVVVIRQQNAVRHAAQQLANVFARLHRHEQIRVIERVQTCDAIGIGTRRKRNLHQSARRNNVSSTKQREYNTQTAIIPFCEAIRCELR